MSLISGVILWNNNNDNSMPDDVSHNLLLNK